MGGNLLTHVHRDNGLDHNGISRHLAMFHPLAANVVQQQHTGLVTRQQFIIPCFVLDGNTHTVAIRIGRQQQVSVALPGIFHAKCHCLLDFRVRIRTGREVAIRLLLLFDHSDVGVTHFF